MHPFVKPQKEAGQKDHDALRSIMRSLGPGCWFLMGSSVKPSPALDLVHYSEDRQEGVRAPSSAGQGLQGGWVGGHCNPSSAVWVTMYSRGGCSLVGVPGATI